MFCQGIIQFGPFFDHEEEKHGVVEEIAKICSFENMKDLEVNKKGEKAKTGDWSNYLTPSMVEHLEKLIQEKLEN
ncbi:hypothetical protein Goshw_026096, partial [Gossypium schwendimanii]|nr:hypothetical protein [Gossypium schwendimanii]